MTNRLSLTIALLFLPPFALLADDYSDVTTGNLETLQWSHGSKSCKTDKDPAFQIVKASANSYVLRQNKCLSFEAAFIYVLIGAEKVLVVDTGAIENESEAPLYVTVQSLISEQNNKPILVVHSHSHNDHTKGDSQFFSRENIDLVSPNHESVVSQLGLIEWPNKTSDIELGDRKLTIIPIPGHQDESIAIYDHQTGWLLTGDTLYPGLIKVKDWENFRLSIARLTEFSNEHPVSLILGGHIEMNTKTQKNYKIGATYQPNEPPLPLKPAHLRELNDKLQQIESAKKLKFQSFIISPLNRLERMIMKVMTRKKNSSE